MIEGFLDLIACPLCGGKLTQTPPTHSPIPPGGRGAGGVRSDLNCVGCGQSFAVKSDVPVLMAGKRPPGEGPGDSDAMLHRRARWDRRSGFKSGMVRRYLEVVRSLLRPDATVLDVGTGPASFPRWIAESAPPGVRIVGLDIVSSLPGVAGPNVADYPNVLLVQASSRRRLPFRDGAFDVVLRRLAPALPEELARVLKPGGALVQFTYGPDHWREVYNVLPELPRPDAESLRRQESALDEHFDLETSHHRGYEEVSLVDVLALLESNPAARLFDASKHLPRLEALARPPNSMLALTTDERTYVGWKR
jgi:SAM-dependent methyltransferase/uncharacterized protein YbaR (Trm112 family)